jgi:formate hydrogenlyase subunit 6/NADH:ubiquinone oxidoreductase subunit I
VARTRIGHFYIDETCIGCGACDHACPGKVDAIYKIEGDFTGRFAIVLEDCIDCGFCIPVCPVDCIHDARKESIDAGTESGWKRIRDLQSWATARGVVSTDYATKPGSAPWQRMKGNVS